MVENVDAVGQIRTNLKIISPPAESGQPGAWRKRDYFFWGMIGFLVLSTLGSIARMVDPEGAARRDAQYEQQQQANTQKATQAKADEKQKRAAVRAALLTAKKILTDNAPRYLVSYSAANSCIEIARAASNEARAHGEDDMSLGFINIQMKCSEWSSLNWNAGRP